ncbi:MAG: ATP-dependent DNA helicase RecQ [Cyclobacteriaceae bacterium]
MGNPVDVLQKYWGYNSFRPLQEDIINSVLDGRDTLALLPTGGGKSICFQVPGMCVDGLCIVVSPLIALMKDQVNQLVKRGIKATSIHSGMRYREIDLVLDNCINGGTKFLYLSPERLKTEVILERIDRMNVSLLAVDEAHCISQWGYDFRPPYLEINVFKKLIPESKLIALTATATKNVKQDIIEKLEMQNERVFQKSFRRDNLSYSVFRKENKDHKLIEILTKVPGSSVVYARNRKKTKSIAEVLNKHKISADYYHAGLPNELRNKKQEQWISNKTRVMVATNAFGMGIDKPDVRTVIHMDVPDSLENYYQEAGRAGRDEKKAYAVLLYNQGDLKELKDHLEMSFPPVNEIKRMYQALANFFKVAVGSNELESYDFDIETFCKAMNYKPFDAFNLIKKLEDEGLLQLNQSFFQPSTIHIPINKSDLYKYEVENARFEPILKVLLRLHGGDLFSGFVNIHENQVARLVKQPQNQIEKSLTFMDKEGVLHYTPKKDSPQIMFLTPRQDAGKISIDTEQISARKKVKSEQISAITFYSLSLSGCRTRIFQEYFDEETYENCGVCDFCVRQKQVTTGNNSLIEKAILAEVKKSDIAIDELTLKVNSHKEEDVIEAVRRLLDDGILKYSEFGKLENG